MAEYASRLDIPQADVYLRAPAPSDTEMLYSFVSDPVTNAHLARMEPWAKGFTFEQAQRQVDGVCRRMAEDDTIMQYFLMSEAGGAMRGCVTLFDHVGSSALLGYYLAPDACGKGYATLSSNRLLQYARDIWELEEAILRISDDNMQSQAVGRRIGANPTDWTVPLEANGRLHDGRIWLLGLQEAKV